MPLLFSACSDDDGDNNDRIVGTWEYVGCEVIVTPQSQSQAIKDIIEENVEFDNQITFGKDGKVDGQNYTLKGDQLTVAYEDGGEKFTSTTKVSLSGNTLILILDYTEEYKSIYPNMEKMTLRVIYSKK